MWLPRCNLSAPHNATCQPPINLPTRPPARMPHQSRCCSGCRPADAEPEWASGGAAQPERLPGCAPALSRASVGDGRAARSGAAQGGQGRGGAGRDGPRTRHPPACHGAAADLPVQARNRSGPAAGRCMCKPERLRACALTRQLAWPYRIRLLSLSPACLTGMRAHAPAPRAIYYGTCRRGILCASNR